jgi:NAD-dependent deacetylase
MIYPDAKPNVIHRVLYEWEKQDKLRAVVTQNIDGLHKAAGNKRVYELHGSIYENYCVDCDAEYPVEKILESEGVPRCDRCGGIIKPWVVLYGEVPDKYTGIGALREISGADTLIVAGTSLQVEPAASYIDHFTGRNLIVINREPTPADERATLVLHGDIEEIITAAFGV